MAYVQANEISGVERVLVCAGLASVDADGQPLHEGDMGAQVGQALDNLETLWVRRASRSPMWCG